MLIGQYSSKLSPKGRVAFPKKFREELGDGLVVTVGYEGSLMVVSAKDWHSLVEVTDGQPFTLGSARNTNRFLLGQATEITLDDQGRFIIPGYLRTHAAITSEVVFLGLNKYVEIWEKAVWESFQLKLNTDSSQIAEHLTNAQNG